MLDRKMEALVNAPLADPLNIYLPEGTRKVMRGPRPQYADDVGGLKLTTKQLHDRKKNAANDKLAKLFDYYAGTSLTAERVAEHMGLYRDERAGTDKYGKPIIARVLDVRRAEQELAWRRKSA